MCGSNEHHSLSLVLTKLFLQPGPQSRDISIPIGLYFRGREWDETPLPLLELILDYIWCPSSPFCTQNCLHFAYRLIPKSGGVVVWHYPSSMRSELSLMLFSSLTCWLSPSYCETRKRSLRSSNGSSGFSTHSSLLADQSVMSATMLTHEMTLGIIWSDKPRTGQVFTSWFLDTKVLRTNWILHWRLLFPGLGWLFYQVLEVFTIISSNIFLSPLPSSYGPL